MTPKVISAASSGARILAWKVSILPLGSGVIFQQPQGTGRSGDDRHIQSRERSCLKSTGNGPVVGGQSGYWSGPPLSTQAGGPSQSSLFTASPFLARDDRRLLLSSFPSSQPDY